ncbi:hypothetical protein G3T14_21700 [Methylobacterium sp. BTF04]|uniref:hypothetical protein n=1 Tax=Methylobacterium sp. BTF04 TaxID=2708300 RepID=UPI0013D3D38A|nr:hypothetical protein [Methylobacterium sp. BTF04]NEU14697.1 hypothetical protein [Methylobacterium sp. BTF04]
MGLTLDHLIFGNGHGMKSPYFDNRLYWLVDTLRQERDGRNGRLYTYMGGFGAQLRSFEWTHPRPGERRELNGREYIAFSSTRSWLRVDAAWALVRMPPGLDEANAEIRAIKAELDAML